MNRRAIFALALCVTIGVVLTARMSAGPEAARAADAAAPAAASAPPVQQRPTPEASIVDQDAPYFQKCADEHLSDSECVGRLIWFKATAGNARFHTYGFQQRIGVMIDWYRVLRTDQRDDRFRAWGLINDPA